MRRRELHRVSFRSEYGWVYLTSFCRSIRGFGRGRGYGCSSRLETAGNAVILAAVGSPAQSVREIHLHACQPGGLRNRPREVCEGMNTEPCEDIGSFVQPEGYELSFGEVGRSLVHGADAGDRRRCSSVQEKVGSMTGRFWYDVGERSVLFDAKPEVSTAGVFI